MLVPSCREKRLDVVLLHPYSWKKKLGGKIASRRSMDFSFSAEQEELYARTKTFARGSLSGLRPGTLPFPLDAWRQCAEFDLFRLPVASEKGDLEQIPLTVARVMEAVGEV